MATTRRARKTRNRARRTRVTKRARSKQSRLGLRMSTRGFKKAKRKGRKLAKKSTFMKLRRRARNPGHEADFTKHFRDKGRIEVWADGEVCLYDAMGTDHDDYYLKPYEVPRFISELKNSGKFAAWHHYTKDMISDEFEVQGRGRKNPGRRGRRNPRRARPGENDIITERIVRRRNCGRNPSAALTKYLTDGSIIRVSDHGHVTITKGGYEIDSYQISRGRLAHFVKDVKRTHGASADDFRSDDIIAEGSYDAKRNPRRRTKGRAKSRSKSRRNPKISTRDAAAIKRVLRKHGYRC